MNKNKALLAGAAMVALSMPLAQKDAKAASATLAASAVVVDAIQLTNALPLHFGTFSVTASATVSLSPAGVRGSGAGVNLVTGANAAQVGTFSITAANTTVNFSTNLPRNLVNGAETIVLNQLTMTGVGTGTMTFTTIANADSTALTAATGGDTINVGGVANVPATAIAGTYSGDFTLTANYP